MANDSWQIELQRLRDQGDVLMGTKDFDTALESYGKAWELLVGEPGRMDAFPVDSAFWLFMSMLEANFQRQQYETVYEMMEGLFSVQEWIPLAVGNAFFHLRAGQVKYFLSPEDKTHEPGSAMDDLARALICGGIEIFDGEDPRFLAMVTEVLDPPAGYKSWEQTRGRGEAALRDKLESVQGFPKITITKKLSGTLA